MGSLARQMNRRLEVVRAQDFKASGQWGELLKFCRAHDAHGEMEYQSSVDGDYMACLLCGCSFDCGELPQPLFTQLLRRVNFSLWLSV
jgi:hypothetical protein